MTLSDARLERPALRERRATAPRLILLAAIIACLPPLLWRIGDPTPRSWHEAICLASSQETWINLHAGRADALLVPRIHDQPRVVKPPMVVWLNMLSWTGLRPETADASTLALRARCVALLLAAVTMLATLHLGRTLGSGQVGLAAMLILATLPFFQKHARMSTYDIALLAGITTAVAAGVRATQRRGTGAIGGWLLCGIATGFAWLSKGPLALPLVLLGVVPAAFMSVSRWRGLIMTALALLVAAAIALPWYAALHRAVPNLAETLAEEFRGPAWDHRPPWYYLLKPNLALPWILFVIAGLLHPFMTPAGEQRRNSLVPWFWFVLVLLLFSFAPPKVPRYVLPLVPALALVAARVWPLVDRRVIVPHWIGVLLASFGLGAALVVWSADQTGLASLGWTTGGLLSAALLTLGAIGARLHLTGRTAAALCIAVIWTAVATTAYWDRRIVAGQTYDESMTAATNVRATLGAAPLRYLHRTGRNRPEGAFLFGMQRIVPAVGQADLESGESPPWVMSGTEPKDRAVMEAAGYDEVMSFRDAPSHERWLWRR